MNRRYVIAGAAVVALVGVWYLYGQSGSSGGSGTVAASPTVPQTSTPSAAASAVQTAQLYGSPTATGPVQPSGLLTSLGQLGQPRDVFVQLVGGTTTSSATVTTTPISVPATPVPSGPSQVVGPTTTPTTPTTAPPPQSLAAEFDINGEPVVANLNDAIPPETQQFTVTDITPTQVVLGLNGALLANGASTVTIKVGQTLTMDDQTAGTSTVIRLVGVHDA